MFSYVSSCPTFDYSWVALGRNLHLPPAVLYVSGGFSVLARSPQILQVQGSVLASQSVSMTVHVTAAASTAAGDRPITVAFSFGF